MLQFSPSPIPIKTRRQKQWWVSTMVIMKLLQPPPFPLIYFPLSPSLSPSSLFCSVCEFHISHSLKIAIHHLGKQLLIQWWLVVEEKEATAAVLSLVSSVLGNGERFMWLINTKDGKLAGNFAEHVFIFCANWWKWVVAGSVSRSSSRGNGPPPALFRSLQLGGEICQHGHGL